MKVKKEEKLVNYWKKTRAKNLLLQQNNQNFLLFHIEKVSKTTLATSQKSYGSFFSRLVHACCQKRASSFLLRSFCFRKNSFYEIVKEMKNCSERKKKLVIQLFERTKNLLFSFFLENQKLVILLLTLCLRKWGARSGPLIRMTNGIMDASISI